ncbi:MAG: peptidoglycan DD-metalloendopeptidase family protein [Proteobacteria bacterium]|nr:peptidoglycan DD-metalloendopeptidase family protein [Pseudomonadota bacterium]
MGRVLKISFVFVLCAVISGCATSYDKRGVYHKVRGGESIQRIAKVYRTDVQTLAEYNNILDAGDIKPGMRLYIPPRTRKAGFKKLPFGDDVAAARDAKGIRKRAPSDKIKFYRGRFIWPVDGKLTSPFGYRDGRRHDGIDIGAKTGRPIKASAAGKVVFAGSMRGYGNLILLRHKDNMFTAYAHNSVNKVKKGQVVKQGDVIGKVGRTGRASGPHLHFEIRHGQTARNPLFFLPKRG